MYALFLFVVCIYICICWVNAEGEDTKKIKTLESNTKLSTAKYGNVDIEQEDYFKELQYNLEFGSGSSSSSTSNDKNVNYKITATTTTSLVQGLSKDMCSCSVTLFYNIKDELKCYEDCRLFNKTRCQCDFLPINLPIKILCYKHNCMDVDAATNDKSLLAPLVTTLYIIVIIFIFLLFLASHTLNHHQ